MPAKEIHSIKCSDAGMACDFHVCDSNMDEVIAAGQDHARRAHGKDVSAQDIKKIVKTGVMCPA